MNVLMLNYEFPPIGGGAANANLCLLEEYAGKSDLRVDVLTSGAEPGFFEEKFSENISIYKVGLHKKSLHLWRKTEIIEWLLKARGHYRRLVRESNYDLTHAFSGFPTGYLCRRKSGAMPYIISLRGSDVPGANARLQLDYKILGPVFRRIWKGASTLVACSEGLKERALAFLPMVSIDVIPNGVDFERFTPRQPRDEAGALRLLTVGRLSVTKRVEMLIDAVDILHRDDFKVHLTIAGGGALEGQFREIISQKGLSDVIDMTGRVGSEGMPAIYRRGDVFVSATMQEGMSNAMLEAMASALPIVTTPCEGVEELIGDNGIVVEDENARALADAIRGLGEDGERYEQMSKAGRTCAEQFSWKSVADRYLSCYNAVMNSHSGRDL